jgi:hypothetical protein
VPDLIEPPQESERLRRVVFVKLKSRNAFQVPDVFGGSSNEIVKTQDFMTVG